MLGKKTKGRKRHIIVDTLGLLLTVLVHSAGIQDTVGAKQVVQKLVLKHIKLKKVFADGGYKERFIDWAKLTHDLEIEVVKRNEQHKFVVLPKRWIVERTFSWLLRNRRLAKDYERLKQSAESMVYIAMTRLMLKRLALTYN
jgi:putative transposase